MALYLQYYVISLHTDPPEVTIEPLENPVVLGSSVQLMCSATGSPPITYEWVQVGKEGAVLNTDTSTGDFSLLITEVSQYGTYMCIARNNAGMDSASVVVVEAGKGMHELVAVSSWLCSL